jgi:hypothetical protein
MAIGSAPEIGVTFHSFGDLTEEQQRDWFARVRAQREDPIGWIDRYRGCVPPLAVGTNVRVML